MLTRITSRLGTLWHLTDLTQCTVVLYCTQPPRNATGNSGLNFFTASTSYKLLQLPAVAKYRKVCSNFCAGVIPFGAMSLLHDILTRPVEVDTAPWQPGSPATSGLQYCPHPIHLLAAGLNNTSLRIDKGLSRSKTLIKNESHVSFVPLHNIKPFMVLMVTC